MAMRVQGDFMNRMLSHPALAGAEMYLVMMMSRAWRATTSSPLLESVRFRLLPNRLNCHHKAPVHPSLRLPKVLNSLTPHLRWRPTTTHTLRTNITGLPTIRATACHNRSSNILPCTSHLLLKALVRVNKLGYSKITMVVVFTEISINNINTNHMTSCTNISNITPRA